MSELMYRVTTQKTVEEAVQAVGSALQENQFGVLWDLNINQKLEEKGIEVEPPFRILEVCSAPRAKQALSQNQLVGYFLPCKVLVYEDRQSHQTTIGYAKPDALMGLLGDERLEPLAAEVDRLLRRAVDQAAQSR